MQIKLEIRKLGTFIIAYSTTITLDCNYCLFWLLCTVAHFDCGQLVYVKATITSNL